MPTLQLKDLKKQLNQPLFAVAGASEAALDYARAYLLETQERLTTVEFEPKAARSAAQRAVNSRVDQISREAKKAQADFEKRVKELQKDAKAFPGKAQVQFLAALTDLVNTYVELADRGEKFVAAIRKDGVKAVGAVKDAPKQSTVARRENQKVAAARKPAASQTRKAAQKAPATRTTAKKATAKKSSPRKTTAKKTTAS
ncbi:MAG TPA: hypothetical protein VFR99_01815 [Marmoricola sp.]|jgi:hypothetical protein|nr:hypothetical protein [Marmoricola sp.]